VSQLPSPPSLWRYGCRRGRMTGVMSSQRMVPVPLLTVHDHVHHVDGASTVVGGPRGSQPYLRVPRAPRVRQKCTVRGRALLTMSGGLGRGGEMSNETPIVPEVSPQGSDEIEFVVRALSS
jgi:hypothetical protein